MRLSGLTDRWDLIVIGGGITGAGVLLAAARSGLAVLLLERHDFAWGTSSRSSKLVHGGLRYLRQGRFLLTRTAVLEREQMLAQAPGLVEPIDFLVPIYSGRRPGRAALGAGLNLYDLIAGRRDHRFLAPGTLINILPGLRPDGLAGAYRFSDAQTDDARLVLRVLDTAQAHGAVALNYTAASSLHRDRRGRIAAVTARDIETGATRQLATRAVINATGAWAEQLHRSPDAQRHLRPLRGSHLVLPARRLPLAGAVSFWHPDDDRGVFVLPWNDAVLVGTTDLDHDQDLDAEPYTTPVEIDYLLAAVNYVFPQLRIGPADIVSTQAGVRPVVSHDDRPPSDESREHVVWAADGLVTVTGGKLTTFRRLAADALAAVSPWLPKVPHRNPQRPLFDPFPEDTAPDPRLDPASRRRLAGRYGGAWVDIVRRAEPSALTLIPGTSVLWAELVHAAGREAVRHLTDLLLRRVRIGMTLPEAAREHLPRIRQLCQPVLGWNDARWQTEENAYIEFWERYCRVKQKNDQ